jgi:hypothetical protein
MNGKKRKKREKNTKLDHKNVLGHAEWNDEGGGGCCCVYVYTILEMV